MAESLRAALMRPFTTVPAGLRLEQLTVVSAYAGIDWFHALERELKPGGVRVILDQGAPRSLLDGIRDAIPSSRLESIQVGIAARLMHAKIYACRWSASGRTRPIHTICIGSANASPQGFLSPGNAETWLGARIYPTKDVELFRWLSQLDGTEREVRSASVTLDRVQIDLPSFRVVDPAKPAGTFDAWLQHGWLCQPFEPHPEFACFDIPLEATPPMGDVGLALGEAGLFPHGPRSVRVAYLGKAARAPDARKGPTPNWRSALFVETTLGGWISDRAYARGRADARFVFKPRRAERRRRALEALKSPTSGTIDQ